MLRFAFVNILSLVLCNGLVYGQCEATAPVRQILERSRLRQEHGLTKTETYSRQVKILEEGLVEYPDDNFLLLARMSAEPNKDAQIRWAETLHKKDLNQPVYALVQATALVGKRTGDAIRMLEALKTKHPEMAQIYLELAEIAKYGKFEDKPRLRQELEGFLKFCPASLDAQALGLLLQNGTSEQIAKTAVGVRRLLQEANDPLLSQPWEALWNMEFKISSPAEYGPLRHQIALDRARLNKSP